MGQRKAKDYVISVSGSPGHCWLALASDEDDSDTLATTSDRQLAMRWSDFVEARQVLRDHVQLHSNRSFKLDVMDPEEEAS